MRITTVIVTLVLSIISTNTIAFETGVNPQAMFYVSIPFDGSAFKKEKTTFGFRLDSHAYSRYDNVHYVRQLDRPAVFDFKLEPGGIEGVYISGIDYYKLYQIHKQNEGEEDIEYEDQVSIIDEIKFIIADMTNIAPMGVWIGAGLGIGLLVGVSF